MSNFLIWFVLVDSSNGMSYKGTTASSVSLSRDSVVDQFRDAVKEKYADSHLKGVAPSDLLVYKNKAAFEQKNADKGKEEPLEEDSLLTGLGTSKKDSLVVVVTSLESEFEGISSNN
jgi:hypothetical protein